MPVYNLGRCLSPADIFYWKQTEALSCFRSNLFLGNSILLCTKQHSATGGGGWGGGTSRAIVQSPTAGPVGSALFPLALEVAMVSSALFIITVAATLEIPFLLGKVTRLMIPTTTSSCPGELQSKVAMNEKKNTTPMITGGNKRPHRFIRKN